MRLDRMAGMEVWLRLNDRLRLGEYLEEMDSVAELAFEERSYALGDTVNVTVGLTPKMDVNVREARLELVWEGRWTSSSSL